MKKILYFMAIGMMPALMASCQQTKKESDKTTNTEVSTEQKAEVQPVQNVTVADLYDVVQKKPDNTIILDVRTPQEVAEGTVPKADTANFLDQKNFPEALKKLDKSKTYYVYCKSGGRSARAAQQMHEMGFEHVKNVTGGFLAWQAADYPIAK